MAQREVRIVKKGKRLRRLNNFFRWLRCEVLQFSEFVREKLSGSEPELTDLVILDDYFPNLQTGFRIAEFHYLQDHLPSVAVYSSAGIKIHKRIRFLRWYNSFAEVYSVYRKAYGQRANKVHRFNKFRALKAKLAYVVFITNTDRFLDYLEKNQIRFVFTLYPGGGFFLDQQESDKKLQRIFSSTFFSGVIVTQPITRDYLLRKNLCSPEKIHHVFGVVVDSARYKICTNSLKVNPTINICFVAFKYMEQGKDKGYDIFIEACRHLFATSENYRFHVVGNFSPTDADITGLNDYIKFYGPLVGDDLLNFFTGMDIILAPNRAFTLHPGAFDGFPTGCCVEAALCGVAVFCTDPLRQNQPFIVDEHFVQIDTDPIAIAEKIRSYAGQPERLLQLKRKGQERFAEIYAIENQMRPRIATILQAMGKDELNTA